VKIARSSDGAPVVTAGTLLLIVAGGSQEFISTLVAYAQLIAKRLVRLARKIETSMASISFELAEARNSGFVNR
jgi:hypothetical protein